MGGADHGHAGEGAHGDFRAKVWSMPGGPNCRPKHWKRNTAIAMAGIFLICIPIAMKSAELEVSINLLLVSFLLILWNLKSFCHMLAILMNNTRSCSSLVHVND